MPRKFRAPKGRRRTKTDLCRAVQLLIDGDPEQAATVARADGTWGEYVKFRFCAGYREQVLLSLEDGKQIIRSLQERR